ncbi:hypothetical protein MB02_07850 [Croceicoccus estronivorus]|uniref:EAL domain-containing protein n=1 Tax=Croceicoccus estronivorus TaxID=1172626 RepID=UPI000829C7E2|nr:EAL domain-containing protein [Croceicoccus estronivorus]OCC24171.1 hypothetical protein MB02_07850 [Croceicoccus estronivorus]
MPDRKNWLSYINAGFAETNWFSAIRIPRHSSADELSYTAQCIEVLRPLLPLMGGASFLFTLMLVVKNWPVTNIIGVIWTVASLFVSSSLMNGSWILGRRLRNDQIRTARVVTLAVAATGVLLGSASGAFVHPVGLTPTLGCVIIGLVIFAAFPLAQIVFLGSFAVTQITYSREPLPLGALAVPLFFCLGAIWISAHVRFTRAKTRMDLHKERFARMSELDGSFVWQADVAGNLTQASGELFATLGVGRDALLQRPIWSLVGAGVKCDKEQMREIAFGTEVLKRHHHMQAPFGEVVICARSKDGIHRLSISGQPRYDSSGNFAGFVGIGLDLTDYSRSQERLLDAAERDALTKLMNRACFNEKLELMLCGQRSGRGATALLLIDLDKFKQANDTLGHQVGDQLLWQVAERLKMFINSTGFVGRLGGDEFGVVLHEISDRHRLDGLAGELVRNLSAPYDISGLQVSIGAAIGIAVGPEHGDTVDALVRNADLALYSAKARGGCKHRFFDTTLLDHALERRQLEIDLGKAIENGELSVQYQPIIDAATDRLCGFEALARWIHSERGEVAADEFIPLAETAGLIDRLGQWILREACAEAAHWPDRLALAVNISPAQFGSPGLTTAIVSSLAQSQLPPERLEIEITENIFLGESETTQAILRQVHNLGVKWVIDDFGTGYSSLKYLLKAPFSKIKIDCEFVNGLSVPDSQKRAIVGTIIALAKSMGMATTAEGVESLNDLKLVKELGCSQVQGFVYGPTLTATEARSFAKNRLPIPAEGFEMTRREPRMVVLRSADILCGGTVVPGTVRNVSSSGAMLEADGPVAVGSRVEIHMDHDSPRSGVIRWVDGIRFGVQFDERYPNAFQAVRPNRVGQPKAAAA